MSHSEFRARRSEVRTKHSRAGASARRDHERARSEAAGEAISARATLAPCRAAQTEDSFSCRVRGVARGTDTHASKRLTRATPRASRPPPNSAIRAAPRPQRPRLGVDAEVVPRVRGAASGRLASRAAFESRARAGLGAERAAASSESGRERRAACGATTDDAIQTGVVIQTRVAHAAVLSPPSIGRNVIQGTTMVICTLPSSCRSSTRASRCSRRSAGCTSRSAASAAASISRPRRGASRRRTNGVVATASSSSRDSARRRRRARAVVVVVGTAPSSLDDALRAP